MSLSNYDYYDMFYESSIHKDVFFEFDDKTYTNENIYSESLEIVESLCSEDALKFGLCESNSCKFTMINDGISRKNQHFRLFGQLNNDPDTKFLIGSYIVIEDTVSADRSKRSIVAYDQLYEIVNADVTKWWNEIATFPCNLYQLRNSFLQYLNVNQDPVVLTNDNMRVDKTMEAKYLSGGDVLRCICELNGCFPNIHTKELSDGTFSRALEYIFLPKDGELAGLFPKDDLYPSSNLYPIGSSEIVQMTKDKYISCDYQEYLTQRINQLQIREEKDDIGVIVSASDVPSLNAIERDVNINRYIVDNNLLVLGKSSEEKKEIAINLLSIIGQVSRYYPFTATCIGNPAIRVGKGILISSSSKIISSIILKRTLRGIQNLKDTYEADGVENYENSVDTVNSMISQLMGYTTKILQDVGKFEVEIKKLTDPTQTSFLMKDDAIKTYVKKGDSVSEINQSSDLISIKSNRFELQSTNLTISQDGTINAWKLQGNAYQEFKNMSESYLNESINYTNTIIGELNSYSDKLIELSNTMRTHCINIHYSMTRQNAWILDLDAALGGKVIQNHPEITLAQSAALFPPAIKKKNN